MSRRVTIDFGQLRLLMFGFFLGGLAWGAFVALVVMLLVVV